MSTPKNRTVNRRSLLLRGVGIAASAAAAGLPVATTDEAHAYDPGDKETRARYRADSREVQAFYRTNGYETLKK